METADRETIQGIQLQRLRQTVGHVYENVSFYRQRLEAVGQDGSSINSLDDLKNIPFTTKQDMRDHYPYGLLAVPMEEVVRIHASSGTTGTSSVVAYTKEDVNNWSECVSRMVCMAGAQPSDIAQISFGYGMFTGGLGLHYGLENASVAVIPISSGNTKRQIQLLQDFRPTIIVSTPSYALYLSEAAAEMGVDLTKLPVRIGLFGGEGHTEQMRAELERRWGMLVTENYGLSEVMGPGVAGECVHQDGMHVAEDHFIIEIIDPDTGEVLPEGQEGEVVITTIQKRGQPLLRYRTRDIASLHSAPCACGRTSIRLSKIKGRSDDMLVIRGVNVFPSQIEKILLGTAGVGPSYEIVVTNENYLDRIEVKVEVVDAALLTSFGALESLSCRIREAMRQELLIDVKITLVNPMTLRRFEGKAQRVTDLRNREAK